MAGWKKECDEKSQVCWHEAARAQAGHSVQAQVALRYMRGLAAGLVALWSAVTVQWVCRWDQSEEYWRNGEGRMEISPVMAATCCE
jgi:hypothetical protein